MAKPLLAILLLLPLVARAEQYVCEDNSGQTRAQVYERAQDGASFLHKSLTDRPYQIIAETDTFIQLHSKPELIGEGHPSCCTYKQEDPEGNDSDISWLHERPLVDYLHVPKNLIIQARTIGLLLVKVVFGTFLFVCDVFWPFYLSYHIPIGF